MGTCTLGVHPSLSLDPSLQVELKHTKVLADLKLTSPTSWAKRKTMVSIMVTLAKLRVGLKVNGSP